MVKLWDPGALARSGSRLRVYLRLVRIEHTLFSLPFAYAGVVLVEPRPSLWLLVWVTVAVVGLRTAAMAFNNIADLEIDRANPRTRSRPLVIGAVSLREAWMLVLVGSLAYYVAAYALGFIPLILSPILWLLAMSYPYAKRLHPLPHIHLGLVLGMVVFGGSVAAASQYTSSLSEVVASVPWLYVAAVTLWVSGFDTIYSIMDLEFDRSMGLKSLPALLGVRGALVAAAVQHLAASLLFLLAPLAYGLGVAALASAAASALLMAYENLLVWRSLDNIARAFNVNLVVAVLAPAGVIVSRLLGV